MKFHEYATFIIIGSVALNLFYSLFNYDWNSVGLSITALGGWMAVAGYEKRDRDERRKADREFEPYGN